MKTLSEEEVRKQFQDPLLAQAILSSVEVVKTLGREIQLLERRVLEEVREHRACQLLCSIPGVGKILALSIRLEAGEISRFARVGNYLSYCRCVGADKFSNQKKKGVGNRYLCWAYIEAATFALRWDPQARRFYQCKKARRNAMKKALAHKLCRASYYVLRDQVPFSSQQLFA